MLTSFFVSFLYSERPSLPMSQRNLPASFWNPSQTDQSQQLQTSFPPQDNRVSLFQQNLHNGTTHCNNGYHGSTGLHGNYDQSAPNVVRTRTIPVSYAQLPAGAVKTFPSGLLAQQAPAHSYRPPTPPFLQETAAQCNAIQTSLRFNPRYNALLVQPEVKPHLPVVPGEPCKRLDGNNNDMTQRFPGSCPGELMMKKGEN